VPNPVIIPSSTHVSSSSIPNIYANTPFWVSSSNDDSEDENKKFHSHSSIFESINLKQHQYHNFLDGPAQHKKRLMIFPMILHISGVIVHSSNKPPLFWLKFQRLMIQNIYKILWPSSLGYNNE
jgi:hypothetical protein